MNRRAFVLATGGVLAAGAAGAAEHPAASGRGSRRRDGLRLGTSYVTNMEQFPDAPRPAMGERLALARSSERRFNPGSIKVLATPATGLGYLPPAFTAMLASMMDGGEQAFAVVTGTEPDGEIAVDLYLAREG